MKYFFVLGINPTLSLAELAAVFNNGEFSLAQKNIAILETDQKIEANIIKKIGGTIKFGLIHDKTASLMAQDILKSIATFSKPEKIETKFKFGISFYGKAKVNLKILGMEFKKRLLQSGIPSRWVVSREPTLSSVVVEQNKLTTAQGAEIVIIQFDKKLFLGKTIAVQPFKELSFRDYGRPARDDYSGMLPPKLAQIIINLAVSPLDKGGLGGIKILDPFCGSGTILTEAMLMEQSLPLAKGEVRRGSCLIGSDISDKALQATKTNISWIKKNYELRDVSYELFHSDATKISKCLAANSVDAIITEPYLGPQRGKLEIEKIIKELEELYSRSLMEFKKILKTNGRVVMVWPVFTLSLRGSASDRSNLPSLSLRATGGSEAISRMPSLAGSLNPNLNGFTIINPIPASLQKNIFINLTARRTMVYGREQQKVWREIVVLEK